MGHDRVKVAGAACVRRIRRWLAVVMPTALATAARTEAGCGGSCLRRRDADADVPLLFLPSSSAMLMLTCRCLPTSRLAVRAAQRRAAARCDLG